MPDTEPAKAVRQSLLTRRSVLILVPLAVLATLAGVTASRPRSTLQAFVDTLLPADEFGPAASDTGAVEALESAFSGSWGKWADLRKLMIWLNVSSGGIFANADANIRNDVVARLEDLPATSARWKNYNRARRTVMRHYFGNTERTLAMGLPGAPQPVGYPDAHLQLKKPERG